MPAPAATMMASACSIKAAANSIAAFLSTAWFAVLCMVRSLWLPHGVGTEYVVSAASYWMLNCPLVPQCAGVRSPEDAGFSVVGFTF